jgi:hypothetical protein
MNQARQSADRILIDALFVKENDRSALSLRDREFLVEIGNKVSSTNIKPIEAVRGSCS